MEKFVGLVPVEEFLMQDSYVMLIDAEYAKNVDREYKLKKRPDLKSDKLEFFEYSA